MATTWPRCQPGTESTLCPIFERSSWSWHTQIQCCTTMWIKWYWSVCLAWVRACAEAFSRNPGATGVVSTPPSLPRLEGKLVMCTRHQQSQASHSPPVSPSDPLVSQEDSSALCRTPGLGHSIRSSSHSLPRAYLCPCILLFSPLSPHLGQPSQTWLISCFELFVKWIISFH